MSLESWSPESMSPIIGRSSSLSTSTPTSSRESAFIEFSWSAKNRRWTIMKSGKFPEKGIGNDSAPLSCTSTKIDWLMQKLFHEKSALIGNRFLIGLHVNDHSMCRKKIFFSIFNLIFICAVSSEGWHKKHSGWKKRNWILLMSQFLRWWTAEKSLFFLTFTCLMHTHDSGRDRKRQQHRQTRNKLS